MRISPVSFGTRSELKGIIYVKPVRNGKTQEGIINAALDELRDLEFNKTDILQLRTMGVNPPFENGKEAVECLEKNKIPVKYGKFSDKNVHACLGRGNLGEATVFINAAYKNSKSAPEVLATAVAIGHEAGHANDNDRGNSIQEELDNLGLSVLIHRALETKHPGVFRDCNSNLVKQGGGLYSKLFADADFNKAALKERVADKYGHMQAGDSKHPASNLAKEIKQLDISG